MKGNKKRVRRYENWIEEWSKFVRECLYIRLNPRVKEKVKEEIDKIPMGGEIRLG